MDGALTGSVPFEVSNLLLKASSFVGLVEFCVEQDKSAVTQDQHTDDEEEVSAPFQNVMSARRRRDSPVV
jgi:hypothetical protein